MWHESFGELHDYPMHSISALDQLTVKCPEGRGLRNFAQVRIPFVDYRNTYNPLSWLERAASAIDNPLQSFADTAFKALGLDDSSKDDIAYVYTCIPLNRYRNCRTMYTPQKDGGKGQTEYLDRQSVFAADNEILTGFHLNTVKNGEYYSLYYQYDVCEIY